MSENMDPFEELRSHISQTGDLPGPESDVARRVYSRVMQRARRRRRLQLVMILPLAAVLIAAGFAILGDRTTTAVSCFDAVDVDANRLAPGRETGTGPDACVEAWETGQLSNPDIPVGSVPPLTGCVNDAGSLWVFPTDNGDVCEELGLTLPDPSQDLSPLIRLEERLAEYIGIDTCVPPDEAVGGIHEILAELELADWTVVARPQRPDSPCASYGIDGENNIVYMIPGRAATSDPG